MKLNDCNLIKYNRSISNKELIISFDFYGKKVKVIGQIWKCFIKLGTIGSDEKMSSTDLRGQSHWLV